MELVSVNKSFIDVIIEAAEALGWSATHNDGEFEFSKYSPAGQDFYMNIFADSFSELNDKLYEQYNNFDCSEETYLWLDESGHGKNGAPHDMKDLYEDMEACENMILELAGKIQEIDYTDSIETELDDDYEEEDLEP